MLIRRPRVFGPTAIISALAGQEPSVEGLSVTFAIETSTLLDHQGRMPLYLRREIEIWGQKHRAPPSDQAIGQSRSATSKDHGLVMQHRIVGAEPHADRTVTILWSDGLRGTVDFSPFITRGGLFAALQRSDYFVREMSVLPGGIGLTWPEEVDFSADGLRRDAVPVREALAGTAG